MDVAQLGISVSSNGADKATSDLNKLTNASKMAEQAADGLSASTKNAGSAAAAAATGFQKAAAAEKAFAVAANQNDVVLKKTGNTANLAAQGFDIFTTAAGGMNAGMIGLQQGLQIAQVAMTSTGGFAKELGAAFLAMLSPVTLLAVGLTALAAVGIQQVPWASAASGAIRLLADNLQTIAPYAAAAAAGLALLYGPAAISGLISIIALLGRISVAALGAAASFTAAWLAALGPVGAVIAALTAVVAGAIIFRDEITQILGVDIGGAAKTGVNYIIGSFVAAFEDIKFVWNNLPNVVGAAAVGAANVVIAAINQMINGAKMAINDLISAINVIPGVNIGALDTGGGAISEIQNTFADNLAKSVGERNKAVQGALSADYLGNFGTAISNGASKATEKLKELAKWIDTTDAKSKTKGGAGGKTEAEKYSDIVDGANRRIASLNAEQAALGMTEQASLALKYETDLLNQAQQKGIELTAAQRAELAGLAGQMASTEIATKKAKEALDFAKDATKGFLSDLRSGLANGEGFFEAFGKAATNVLDKIISKIEDQLVEALFSVSSVGSGGGGGGFLGAIFGGIGKLFGFASGGYTGNAAASSVAGIVHGGEYVFSKKATDRIGVGNLEAMHRSAKGYASGGYVAPIPASQQTNMGRSSDGLHITVGVSADNNGNLMPFVESVSERKVQQAAPSIVNAANQQVVPTMAKYQGQKAGGDWRSA